MRKKNQRSNLKKFPELKYMSFQNERLINRCIARHITMNYSKQWEQGKILNTFKGKKQVTHAQKQVTLNVNDDCSEQTYAIKRMRV